MLTADSYRIPEYIQVFKNCEKVFKRAQQFRSTSSRLNLPRTIYLSSPEVLLAAPLTTDKVSKKHPNSSKRLGSALTSLLDALTSVLSSFTNHPHINVKLHFFAS